VTPWVKTPVDLPRAVARLPESVQSTFFSCFILARRRPPHRGYLVSDTLQPLTIRALAAELSMPRSTLHDRVQVLLRIGYLVRDLAGWILVPLVLETERRLNARTTIPTASDDGENGAPRDVLKTAPIMAAVRPGDENARYPDNDSLFVLRAVDERRNVASPEGGVENYLQDDLEDLRQDRSAAAELTAHALLAVERTLGDVLDSLPSSITDPTVRYLLAKLQSTAPAWHGFPSSTRDVALLERLEVVAPSALISALQQESLSPTAKRPGAWLSRAVPAIAGEGALA
jgi:hypothetical protein